MGNSKFEQLIIDKLSHHLLNEGKRTAFFINGESYSYDVLNQIVGGIRQVIESTLIDEQIWALSIHDDIETYASILALWMEGKSYVPLHPNQPLERNLNIISQVGIHCLLDSAECSQFENQVEIIKHTKNLSQSSISNREWRSISDDELAYILFTSGSTGTPKGVCISRNNIASFVDSFWKTGIHLDQSDQCLQAFDLTFDVSIQSFLLPLLKGACIYTIPLGQIKYLYAASLIMEHSITFGAMAPSMLTYLRPYFNEIDARSLKTCILTAEACPIDLIEEWANCASNTEIYDFYGPTEATIYCTYYKLSRDAGNLSANGIVSIGKPLANVHAIIVDELCNPVETSQKGELCVAGDQIAIGYWKNKEKNETSFFTREKEGVSIRYYHTGDLCYQDETGNIIYCGRIDQQAKIQGFRVELGEIEYHARKYFDNEKRTLAIAYENEKGLTEIALFVESPPLDTTQLITYLENNMPHYMIPSRILFEEHFPLNNSDKIDRKTLKQKIHESR